MSARAWGGMGLALLLGVAGCSSKHTTTAPEAPRPPQIAGTYPEPRATRVPDATPIWARFTEPLDPATVNDKTVFLKIDTQRIPIHVALRDSGQRIDIVPAGPLALRRTFTVEISPAVRTVAGSGFADTYFWQFTTVSLRRIVWSSPADGTVGESPVAPLAWTPNDPAAGLVRYDIFVDTDSTRVASETAVSVATFSPPYLPALRWFSGTRLFWRVKARNLETGDEDRSAVWRFETLSDATPADSVNLRIIDSGTYTVTTGRWTCPQMIGGPIYRGMMRIGIVGVDSTTRVLDARIEVAPTSQPPPTTAFEIDGTARTVIPCDPGRTGPPAGDTYGVLSRGVLTDQGVVQFHSDLLAAHIQAMLRTPAQIHGYDVHADRNITFVPLALASQMVIVFARPNASGRPAGVLARPGGHP